MAVTEAARHQLYGRLEEVLGNEEAATLMDHLPHGGWANLATKDDVKRGIEGTRNGVDSLAAKTDLRFDEFESKMDLRFDELAARFDVKLDAKIDGVRQEIDGVRQEIAGLRHLLSAEIHKAILRYSTVWLGILVTGGGVIATIVTALD